jgi:Fe-S cluster assembly protein SufD
MNENLSSLELGEEELVQRTLRTSDSPLILSFRPHCKQSVILTLEGEGRFDIKANIPPGANITLLWWNRGNNLDITEVYDVESDARLMLAYSDLKEGALTRKSEIRLIGANAHAEMRSASVVTHQRKLSYQMTHLHSDTISTMANYAVMAESGQLKMDVIGRIEKSAPRSVCHQSSRVLNLATHQKATIHPKLYIDNNDVQAGHAQSIGQVDAQQLYYLQTRGLTHDEATKLIVYGYLYPVAEVIEDENLRDLFLEEIREKVNQTCLT